MACVGFSSNVEVLLRVFWELLEKESQECVDILASCNGVANRATTVRVPYINWLIEENHRSICVPRVWIAVKFQLGIDGRWAKFEEKASEG
jgi:hypothetical protein